MRIVFSTDQIYNHGGLEKVMAEKANYFVEQFGYEVFIITTEQYHYKACYKLNDKIQILDLEVNYDRDKSYFHFDNIKKIPYHFSQWKKAINSIQPDVLIVCNQSFDFYWTPFVKTKIKKLKEYHSTAYNLNNQRKNASFFQKIKFVINDYIESKFDKLILLNNDEKQFYKSNNIVVIPNPIQLSDKTALLNNKIAIAAGRIAPVKGFESLIKAWKAVVKENKEWQLHIYGDGEIEYLFTLEELINQRKISKSITIRPAISNLQDAMLASSMYVMSSLNECFPMVLLESLSIGLPIVSFDCPTGPRNIITNNEDGFLVQDQNIQQLSEKIVFLIRNFDLRKEMGTNAKKNSIKFEKETVMMQWKVLFNNLKEE